MRYGLQQIVFIGAVTAALAAIDPCSEVYPGLNADFVTTQTKVTFSPEPSLQDTYAHMSAQHSHFIPGSTCYLHLGCIGCMKPPAIFHAKSKDAFSLTPQQTTVCVAIRDTTTHWSYCEFAFGVFLRLFVERLCLPIKS